MDIYAVISLVSGALLCVALMALHVREEAKKREEAKRLRTLTAPLGGAVEAIILALLGG
jgi:hypothetical protein